MGYAKDRTDIFRCRLTPDQKTELAARAEFLGLSMTDYVLSSALNRRLPGYGASKDGKGRQRQIKGQMSIVSTDMAMEEEQ